MKPRYLKSIHTINAQPETWRSQYQLILLMDIAGHTGAEISKSVGLTENRVSAIKNSPIYGERQKALWIDLSKRAVNTTADSITNEEVRVEARKSAMKIVKTMVTMALDDESAFAKLQAGREVLKIGQVVEERKRTKEMVIEVGEKWAERWDRALNYDERSKSKGQCKITLKEEVSS